MRSIELEYDLPESAIAQRPLAERGASRLLCLEAEGLEDRTVTEWPELIEPGSLVVLNDTRVLAARVFGARVPTGGKVEVLFLRPVSSGTQRPGSETWKVLIRANRGLGAGERLRLGELEAEVLDRVEGGASILRCDGPVLELLKAQGHVPLPPYIRREDEESDRERYQTVYARRPGSAAAPTAGLHITESILKRLADRGVEVGKVTLHVGAGTFKPVAAEELSDHPMHRESFSVESGLAQQVRRAKEMGRPVIAVGTTVVRALESSAQASGELTVGGQETELLIAPGYTPRVVGGLLTNFHAPRSTLLALVFAFAGAERVRRAYEAALARGYRFLSYGDAMWISPEVMGEHE